MKALVTGGAGFIGSNIVSKLLANGLEVRVIDDLSSGYKVNIDGLPIVYVKGDICDEKVAAQVCEGVDVVFHLAASVGRQRSLDYPQLDSKINVGGTINILEGMRKNGVHKIVYSSSAAIFGELVTSDIDENHPQNADSPYGISKLAAEKMILAYNDIYGFTGVCLRYFNVYGINQRFDLYGNVIPIFAKRIYENGHITIYGDGEQTRDFLNVRDIAEANFLAATSGKRGVYNLGSGSSISINKLAGMMKEIGGQDTPVEHFPERPADVRHCKANAGRALKELGFRAAVGLEEGLWEYMHWFETNGQ